MFPTKYLEIPDLSPENTNYSCVNNINVSPGPCLHSLVNMFSKAVALITVIIGLSHTLPQFETPVDPQPKDTNSDSNPPFDLKCRCPRVGMKVCGTDGITYWNSCEAECNNAIVDYNGECVTDGKPKIETKGDIIIDDAPKNVLCKCPKVWKASMKVSGSDGKTYWNKCYAECKGASVAYAGECEESNDVDTDDTVNEDVRLVDPAPTTTTQAPCKCPRFGVMKVWI